MSETDMMSSSDVNEEHARRTILEEIGLTSDDGSSPESGSLRILRSALAALSAGRVSEAVEQFADCFTFNDRALTLEFREKVRLTEFFEKSRELFPDAVLEMVSVFGEGNHAIAQWRLSATQTVPCGPIGYRFPISVLGATIVRVEDERIVQWSDYYDQSSSRRMSLVAFFPDWIEY